MKKNLLLLLFIHLFYSSIAQVSDTAIKNWSNYTCPCFDTIRTSQPEEEMIKQIRLCQTIGFTYLLNEKQITPEVMSDKKLFADFQRRGLEQLLADCKSFQQLIAVLDNEPAFDEKNEASLFIPAAFFETYGLKQGETNTRLHVYNNFGAGTPKFQRLVDIRWTFKTEVDAMKWHSRNMRKNAEGGEPVEGKLVVPGASGLRAFREGGEAAEMMKAMGVGQRHHYFLFVYKNIACKIFVATDEKTNTEEAVPFVIAAVEQLQAAVK